MYVTKFEAWFNELQGFHLKSERFYDLLDEYEVTNKRLKERLRGGLESAYNSGYEQGHMDASPED